MKKILFFFVLLATVSANAHEFSETCSTGQVLYYKTLNGYASVTYAGSGSNPYNGYTKPSGDLIIPDTVNHNGYSYPVLYIDNKAFYECSELTSVTIPTSITTIGGNSFYGCSGLTTITIPGSVTRIVAGAFKNCSNLTTVFFQAIECTQMGTVSSPAFANCPNLTSLHIDLGVTTIPSNAFYGCTSLNGTLVVPGTVTSIGNSAFYGCSGLSVLDLGNALTEINAKAFYNCSNLDTIVSRSTTPPTVGNVSAFENVDKTIPLIVPAGCRDAYANAYAWRDFFNISDNPTQGIADTQIDGVVLSAASGRIAVTGADGRRIVLTDLQGRPIYRGIVTGTLTLDIPATGIYLLQLDRQPAHRIAVVK